MSKFQSCPCPSHGLLLLNYHSSVSVSYCPLLYRTRVALSLDVIMTTQCNVNLQYALVIANICSQDADQRD